MASEVVTIGIPVGLLSVIGYALLREVLAKIFEKRNGKSPLTKEQHDVLCEPVKKQLENGEQQIKDLRSDIKSNHTIVMEHLLKLAEKK
jgi:hypothetical protein